MCVAKSLTTADTIIIQLIFNKKHVDGRLVLLFLNNRQWVFRLLFAQFKHHNTLHCVNFKQNCPYRLLMDIFVFPETR